MFLVNMSDVLTPRYDGLAVYRDSCYIEKGLQSGVNKETLLSRLLVVLKVGVCKYEHILCF